jgi:response regulator RpfG family c-di-GMP phosphodiesterase
VDYVMSDFSLKIFVVEDEPEIREALEDIASKLGYEVYGFPSAEDCIERLQNDQCDILVTDLKLPGIDGVELARQTNEKHPEISIIFITAYGNLSSALDAIEYGAEDYIIKPFNVESIKHSLRKVEEKRKLEFENKQYRAELENELSRRESEIASIGQQLEETFFKTVQLLGNAQESREAFLFGRTERVTICSIRCAQYLNWTNDQIIKIAIAAPVSDVGKISISDEILNFAGPLSKEEMEEVKGHVIYGEQIIRSLPHFQDVGWIIRYHHERLDGSGYPEGLKGEDVPETALLIGLCDTFDAMVHDRSWRRAHSVEDTFEYLRSVSGVHFPEKMVDAFITVFKERHAEKLIGTKPVDLFYDICFPLLELANM